MMLLLQLLLLLITAQPQIHTHTHTHQTGQGHLRAIDECVLQSISHIHIHTYLASLSVNRLERVRRKEKAVGLSGVFRWICTAIRKPKKRQRPSSARAVTGSQQKKKTMPGCILAGGHGMAWFGEVLHGGSSLSSMGGPTAGDEPPDTRHARRRDAGQD